MSVDVSFPLFLFLNSMASPFGIPLEETFSIILAGSFSNTFADYIFFVTLIFTGLVIGDIAAYTTASYFETGFIKKLRKYDWYTKTYEHSERFFNKYGALSVFLTRFLLIGLGAPINYLSGLSKYPFRKFLISAVSGEFLYAAIYAYIGFSFKDSWFSIFAVIIKFSFILILILAGGLTLILLKKYLKNGRQ
jgi:membrane-associated protein